MFSTLPSTPRLGWGAAFLALAHAFGCADGSDRSPDASQDIDAASTFDAAQDAGQPADSGPNVDSGPVDAGFADPATFLEGIESIGGVRTYVRMMGDRETSKPPLVFLHTGPQIAHEYLPDPMRFLLPGRLLVFYDMRAAGRTSFGTTGTATITVARHVADLDAVIDFIGIHANFTEVDLIGHGYGGGVAALYAAEHPERVSSLVLVTPYPANVFQQAAQQAEIRARLSSTERARIDEIVTEPECRGNESMCVMEVWAISGPHYLCSANEDRFSDLHFMYGSFRVAEFVQNELINSRYDWSSTLATIRARTTVISGPCDPTPPEAALVYSSTIAGAQHYIIPNTGHFPMVEARAEFETRVRDAITP